jgi:hypothetical protein
VAAAGKWQAGRPGFDSRRLRSKWRKGERENVFSLIGLEEPKLDVRVLVVRDEDHSLPRSG